jgi:hypothetical protein
MTRKKLGILQSRGLGDLVIALPIAHYYYQEGNDIYWPICEPFWESMKNAAPWVHWIPIPTDPHGLFFVEEPLKRLKNFNIEEDQILWLYQYINSHPERTDLDLFAMMKFDQYKYATAAVPFKNKWLLDQCITRNTTREQQLYDKLVKNPNYWVIHQKASDCSYDIDTSNIDPTCQIIEITEQTNQIWDWLTILEKCQGMILIDSVFANLVDQLDLNPTADRYFMRKWDRNVDGNPVFLQEWTYLHVDTPPGFKFHPRDIVAEQNARKNKLGS